MDDLPALSALFLTALLAATVLPAQSEFVLAGLHLAGTHDGFILVAVATAGNVLGSTINWLLGRYLIHFQNRRWFPIKGRILERVTLIYQRWGVWTLLLAWTPIIGDPPHSSRGYLPDPTVGVPPSSDDRQGRPLSRNRHGYLRLGQYGPQRAVRGGGTRSSPAGRHQIRAVRSRSALAITETELRAIAAAAMIGLKSKPKAG